MRDTRLSERTTAENRFDFGALFEFSTIVNTSLDLKFILGHFLLTLMGKLLSLRGIILLARAPGVFSIENVKGLPSELLGRQIEIRKLPRRLLYVNREQEEKHGWISHFREQGIHLVMPLRAGEKTVGIAGFAPSSLKKKLSLKQLAYVKALGNIAAAAIEKGIIINELRQVNRRLDGKVQELNTLFELSKEFNAVLDPDRLIKLLTFSILGQIGANRYVICLEQDGEMKVVASRLDHELSDDLRTFFATVSSPVMVENLTKKSSRQWQARLQEIGIHLLIPLQLQNKPKGVIALGEKMRGGEYTPADAEFLFSLGNLAIISLENARLFKEAIEKQRLEDELLIAKEIQKGLLPDTLPSIPGFEIAAVNISSKQVGGDYYDALSLGNSKYVLAIGDVSGKGTPASLLMANLQATIRALVPLGLSLSELTKRVNDLVYENTGTDRFITFFWGLLQAETGRFNYVSAGHNPPFLFHKDGSIDRLERGGLILGIMKTLIPYEEGEVHLSQGDVLVLFTDGVSEAMNAAGEELGEEPIEKAVKACLDIPAEQILARIVETVKAHSQNTAQSDDITLLVLKANQESHP